MEIGRKIKTKLKSGDIVFISFLSVDVYDHDKILKKTQPEKYEKTFKNYELLITSIVNDSIDGDFFKWDGDGGILVFWGDNCCDNAVLAGIKIFYQIDIFNIDFKKNLNPNFPLKLRIAIHCGNVKFLNDFESMHEPCLNYACHLEKKGTDPDTLNISSDVYQRISEQYKDNFIYTGYFDQIAVYAFNIKKRAEPDFEKLFNQININMGSLKDNLKLFNSVKIDTSEQTIEIASNFFEKSEIFVSKAREKINAPNQDFHSIFKLIDSIESFLINEEELFKRFTSLIGREDLINKFPIWYQVINNCYLQKRIIFSHLRALVYRLKQNRENLKEFDDICLDERISNDSIGETEIKERIEIFNKFDEYKRIINFIELMLIERIKLLSFLKNNLEDNCVSNLLEKLWFFSDLILIEDYGNGKSLFTFLENLENNDHSKRYRYLKIIIKEICEKGIDSEYLIKLNSELDNREYTEEEKQMVYRAIFIFSKTNRKFLFNILDFHGLWTILKYHKCFFSIIKDVSNYITEKKEADLMRIFFDVTRKKIISFMEKKNEGLLNEIKNILLNFYQFNFFIEKNYFSHLNDMRITFSDKCKNYSSINTEILYKYHRRIEKEKKNLKDPIDTLPKCLIKIPLPILLTFARDGLYIDFFILHPRDEIALETEKFINNENINKYLSMASINKSLFYRLIKNESFFKDKIAIIKTLKNPKCNKRFAQKYIKSLNKGEIKQIASNPNINTDVRYFLQKSITLVQNSF